MPSSPEILMEEPPTDEQPLERLLSQLKVAQQLFYHPDTKTGGREGVMLALHEIIEFIRSVPEARSQHLVVPLITLLTGLKDLKDGVTVPLLKAEPKRGQRASRIHKQMMAAAVAGLKILTNTGVPEDEAAKDLARALNELAVKKLAGIGSRIEPETVIEWKSKIAEISKDDAAVITYKAILEQIQPPEDIHQRDKKIYVLNGLKRLVTGFRVPDYSTRFNKDSTLMANKVPGE